MKAQLEKIDIQEIKGKTWFGIITIRNDEFEAVLRQFKPRWIAHGESHYNIAKIENELDEQYYVAIVKQPEQGHGDAQQTANNLIGDLSPECLVVVGICGAKPEFEFTLGDVLVCTRFRDFSVHAALPGGKIEHMDLGGPAHTLIQNAVANLPAVKDRLQGWNHSRKIRMTRPPVDLVESNLTGDENWNDKVRAALSRYFGDKPERRTPMVYGVTLVSGNVLQKDPKLLEKWLEHARDLKGVEMELPGVYRAARRASGDVPVLGVRGISDIVGFKRNPDWTKYACKTAASFAHAYLSDAELAAALIQKPIGVNRAKENNLIQNTPRLRDASAIIDATTSIERFGSRRTAFPSDHSINELENDRLIIAPNFTTPTGQLLNINDLARNISGGNHALLLGDPGSGKSVAIYKLAQSLRELGYQAIPIRFSDLRRLFASGLPFERTLTISNDNKAIIVLVDGLDEASVTDSIGVQTISTWLEKLSTRFTVVISCRRAEFESYLSRYVATIVFSEVVNLNLWRLEVEFAKFVYRLVELDYLKENSLVNLVSKSPMLGRLASRPLFARMLCNIGSVDVESIRSVEDLYTRFFDGLATRTESSLREANCFLETPVKTIWAESAWSAFRLELLSDESLNFPALVRILSPKKTDNGCVSRALTQIIDTGAQYWRPEASYIHYSFYEFLLSFWILDRLLDDDQTEETLTELFYTDLPRRVRHFLVEELKKSDYAKVGQKRLLTAYRNLKVENPLDDYRVGCNLIVYILSRVYACYPILRELFNHELDLFLRNSLFWGLAHSGDMVYTEQFIHSLINSSEHLQMCRGYLLYYHGDLEIVDRPPFIDASPHISWQRTKSAISEFMGTVDYQNTVRVARRVIDAYTFMSFAKDRGETIEQEIAVVLRECILGIRQDSSVPEWIWELLDEIYFETCKE